MKVYVLCGYDEDYYTFETFIGVFSSKEKAEEFRDNDYDEFNDEKISRHEEYEIFEETIDDPLEER